MRIALRGVLPQSTAALLIALAVGCGKNNNNNPPGQDAGPTTDGGGTVPDGGGVLPDGGTLGSGALTTSTAIASDGTFAFPLDSAPSPDGTQVYFAAVQPSQTAGGPGLFKVAATGGATTNLTAGGPIGAILGIAVSSDGSKIYAADPAYATANDQGAIFSVPSAGGSPTVLAETADYAPRSLAVVKVGGSDNLYFIGDDKTDGSSGIFKDAAGAVTAVLKGAAAGDPQAVAAYADGTLYFVNGAGLVQKIAVGGAAATALPGVPTNLAISFPAGIEVSQDGKFVLVPVTDPATKHQSIARIDVSSGAVTQLALTLPITNQEAGGLHRAANADVYSFVDTGASASPSGLGTVYLLK